MGSNPIWGSDFFCVLLWLILYISLIFLSKYLNNYDLPNFDPNNLSEAKIKHYIGNIQYTIYNTIGNIESIRNYNFTAYCIHDYKISSYLDLTRNSANRKDLLKLCISNHKLMIETGRYDKTPYNDRFCPVCNSGIIEDISRFLLHCSKYSIPRKKFYNQIQHNFVDFQLSCTYLITKLMNSQNFSVNSHLLKFVSLCYDLRNNLLSNHADDTWLTIVIIALYYH